jgi:hypothetical protein
VINHVAGAGLVMLTLATSGASYVVYVLPAVVVFGLELANADRKDANAEDSRRWGCARRPGRWAG